MKAPTPHVENFLSESVPNAISESQTLLASLSNGDASAFWKLWECHRAHLYAICLQAFRKTPYEAEDALSDVMLKAIEKMPQFADRIVNPRAWLSRFTYNHCLDVHRMNKLRRNDRYGETDLENALTSDASPESLLGENETQEYFHRLSAKLPQSLQEVFILRFFHEMDYGDIAVRLNLSPATVRKRIQRARIFLKSHLKWERGKPETENDRVQTGDVPNDAQKLRQERVISAHSSREKPPSDERMRYFSLYQASGIIVDAYLPVEKNLLCSRIKSSSLKHCVQRHSFGWKKRLALAHLRYASGDLHGAAVEYRCVIERKPHSIESWLQLGHVFSLLGQEKDAIDAYEGLLPYVRSDALRHHVYGLIQACQRNFSLAIQELQCAVSLSPNQSAHWQTLGLIHLHLEQAESAFVSFQANLRLNPNNSVPMTYSHDALMLLNRPGEASQQINQALECDDENVLALKRAADLRCQKRLVCGTEGATTRRLLRKMKKLAFDSADVHESLAFYYGARGEWSAGIEVLEEFTRRHPKNPSGWRYLALWLFRTGKFNQSANAIATAHALNPQDANICKAACEIFSEINWSEKLKEILGEMTKSFPNQWSVWNAVGRATTKIFQNPEKGCSLSEHALHLQPTLAAAWLQHGNVLALAGKVFKSIEAFEEGWRRLPETQISAQAIWSAIQIGICHRRMGDEKKARE